MVSIATVIVKSDTFAAGRGMSLFDPPNMFTNRNGECQPPVERGNLPKSCDMTDTPRHTRGSENLAEPDLDKASQLLKCVRTQMKNNPSPKAEVNAGVPIGLRKRSSIREGF